MELDELKQAWAGMDLRQEGMEALLRADFHDRRRDGARAILRWSLAGQALELAAWIAFTILAATFWVQHRGITHWLVVGLVFHAYGIAGIWACATQLLLLSRIYLFDAPVVTVQRRITQLRRFRVWCTLALGLPWWCLWLPASLAVWFAWTGIDGFAAGSAWIWACMAVGVVGIGLSAWLARRLAQRPIRSPLLRQVVDDMSGRNLARAARRLDEIIQFERE